MSISSSKESDQDLSLYDVPDQVIFSYQSDPTIFDLTDYLTHF